MLTLVVDKDLDYVLKLANKYVNGNDNSILLVTNDILYARQKSIEIMGTNAIHLYIDTVDTGSYDMTIYDLINDIYPENQRSLEIIHLIPNINMINDYFNYNSEIYIDSYNISFSPNIVTNSSVTIVPDDTKDNIEDFNNGVIGNIMVSLKQSEDIDITPDYLFLYSLDLLRYLSDTLTDNVNIVKV